MFKFNKLILAVSLAVVGTFSQANDKEPLVIAAMDPLSGAMAGIGLPLVEQLEFQAKIINERGGIDGRQIEIVRFDNKLDPSESLIILQKAIDRGIRYIAHMGGDAVASALLNALERHNKRNPDKTVIYLNYGANSETFTNEKCSFWHFLFDNNTQMKLNTLTQWISENDNLKKVYIINPDYSFGHDVSRYVKEMLKAKNPDHKIVGDAFVGLGKVKDFSPYVSQIKASGADVVVTGNWGQDMTLLVKAAASYGLEIPIITLYGDSAGTVGAIGNSGVNRVYLVSTWPGETDDPELTERQLNFKKQSSYDYSDMRSTYMFDMLVEAVREAKSVEPKFVASALENLRVTNASGEAIMRKDDHQMLAPMHISMLKNGMKHGRDDTKDLNFANLATYTANDVALPTTCKMARP